MPNSNFEPIIEEFSWSDSKTDWSSMFLNMTRLPNAIYLAGDSQAPISDIHRYSFLCADPIDGYVIQSHEPFCFDDLRQWMRQFESTQIPDLPPFQGGLAGLLAYELNGRLESVPQPRCDEFRVPLVAMFAYDVVVALDHSHSRAWIISQGWPETERIRREDRARSRLDFFKEHLLSTDVPSQQAVTSPRRDSLTAPLHRVDWSGELYSDFSKSQFLDMIRQAVEYIHAGDVFQVNLSQRLLAVAQKPAADLFVDLCRVNPAPFASYFDLGGSQVASASPERLIRILNSEIQTRPIKGTRPRTRYPEVDLNIRQELLLSEKDRAENTMIVDLMRNDLSLVARPESVRVETLCGIEQFQSVLHLVSVVAAQLDSGKDCFDALQAVFPGGSITGAPKIRAMEIISELEPTARGAYCGSMGYINFDGNIDFNILIRTITAKDGWWQIPVGGGIVSDSDPEQEYDETWTKAVGMLRAIENMPAGVPHHAQQKQRSATP